MPLVHQSPINFPFSFVVSRRISVLSHLAVVNHCPIQNNQIILYSSFGYIDDHSPFLVYQKYVLFYLE